MLLYIGEELEDVDASLKRTGRQPSSQPNSLKRTGRPQPSPPACFDTAKIKWAVADRTATVYAIVRMASRRLLPSCHDNQRAVPQSSLGRQPRGGVAALGGS